MTSKPIIHVNEAGEDTDGYDFSDTPDPEAVRLGLIVSEPVILKFPDGRQEAARQVRLTPKGIAQISRDLGLSERTRQ